ncbi:MAG: GNAT family N-acetyltransferase [bacterium]
MREENARHEALAVDLRDAVADDVRSVHALNQANLPAVGSTSLEKMQWYLDEASCFRVVEVDGEIAAYLVAMTPEVPYDSGNFLWFRERGRDFVYIDRVAVAESHRGEGIGRALYRDVEVFARRVGARRLTCEVNVRPRNEGSLRFHAALGFRGLEERDTDYGPRVLMMERLL